MIGMIGTTGITGIFAALKYWWNLAQLGEEKLTPTIRFHRYACI
jgi:hypothetical protein